jgi:hypothetical protein
MRWYWEHFIYGIVYGEEAILLIPPLIPAKIQGRIKGNPLE